MLLLYFSGTGNSQYVAELFCKFTDAKIRSIEEKIDFGQLITSEKIIGFCYPVYGSRVPRIMREFVIKNMNHLKNKKVIIFCTQLLFSGDGARAFIDIFPKNYFDVIYAEHFSMPNNICNLFILPVSGEIKIKKYLTKAEQKMRSVCDNIKNGVIKKRGFNIFSRILGLSQGLFWLSVEKKYLDTVAITDDCNQCCLCVKICPMNNLEYQDSRIIQKSNCGICYRCINKCPQKAITILFRKKVKNQYQLPYFPEIVTPSKQHHGIIL